MHTVLSRAQFVRWRAAIFAIFLASGLSIATWASRVPDIKVALEIDKAQVGLLLLGMGIASIIGISSSPAVMARTGARLGMLISMLMFGVGVTLIGVGANVLGSVPVVLLGLVMFGFGNGCLDVMMNVEATAIEQRMGKTILPVFHAFFSFGTVIGAGLGAVAARFGFDVATHASTIGIVIIALAFLCFSAVPQHEQPAPETDTPPSWGERMHTALEVWREPRIWALGIVMLGMSFAEGGANDWLALGVVEGHGGAAAVGAAALAVFSVAMTAVRLIGGPLVDRFGRVTVLRVLGVTAAAGIALFILANGNLVLVFTGAALWGVGASLGFPLGMSAAADDPAKAAARVSACATIGYVAFLGGPPILGLISEHIGLLNTLWVLVALAALSCLFSGAARPLRDDEMSTPAMRSAGTAV
ncbi:MFS transporter [Microbacterium sp. YY-01]|uniref:MFS transporter n=1 Tax=Microbacterium sp. YY-01 TaxID=3421634 RepID=UPI003D163696